ncbi:MAG: serine/threonine-protein kinase [Candidatus Melainabacteria bacterium]|nr:serine/threonine-protein kinase [Candidatus Melainabacteria bacterium]
MDQSQSEIATETDQVAQKKTDKTICDTCDKPLTSGASGTISMWIFDGIYCACKPEKRTAQIIYSGTSADSGDKEAAALASLIATSSDSTNRADAEEWRKQTPSGSSDAQDGELKPSDGQQSAEMQTPGDFQRRSDMHERSDQQAGSGNAKETKTQNPPKLRLVENSPPTTNAWFPDRVPGEVTVAAESVPFYAVAATDPSAPKTSPLDFNPHKNIARSSPATEPLRETVTREILAAAQIALSQPETLVGKIIGDNYLVIEFIGTGFNGNVYKVNRDGIPGVFALKILYPTTRITARENARFLAEAKLVKELDHHNVIALYDAGITDDLCPFVVTDLFGSERLSDTLDADGPFHEDDAIDLFVQIADGLAHAHYMGVTHRDVKPSNVRIKEEEDGAKVIKISDGGIGKMYWDPTRETRYFTESGMEYGDTRYMSPEQYSGAKPDHRADIYSFGCLMYEVLTGRAPFVSNKASMLIYKHIKEYPESINERVSGNQISEDLNNLIMRCLQKNPDNRYQSVSDLKDDLETIKSGKPVRRVFKTGLTTTSGSHSTMNGAFELSVPYMVLSRITAAWLTMWVGYTTSARQSIKIVMFSAIFAFWLLGIYKVALLPFETERKAEPSNSRTQFRYPINGSYYGGADLRDSIRPSTPEE